ncbi:MAG: adenylosuccinate lyase, partial [Planctomycetota bacterium]
MSHLTDPREFYESPLAGRYAGQAMKRLWSLVHQARLWRRLWLWLAEAQQELGLEIGDDQLAEMRAHLEDIDLDDIAARENELRHDVMAHLHSFGALCPGARPILHLGATSCFVGDNTDLVVMRDGLRLIRRQVVSLIAILKDFALEWR